LQSNPEKARMKVGKRDWEREREKVEKFIRLTDILFTYFFANDVSSMFYKLNENIVLVLSSIYKENIKKKHCGIFCNISD
jgi:hypothetical protein